LGIKKSNYLALTMAALDILFLLFLGYGFYSGFRNGLFVELASLLSFIIGVWVAIKCSYLLGGWVSEHLNTGPDVTKGIAFLLTLIGVVIGIHLLAKTFTSIASFAFLGSLNKWAGALISVLKTMILLGLLILFLQKVSWEDSLISEEKRKQSILYSPLVKTSAFMVPTLSQWVQSAKEEAEKKLN
jgi:membrane protein required for colicin V production